MINSLKKIHDDIFKDIWEPDVNDLKYLQCNVVQHR